LDKKCNVIGILDPMDLGNSRKESCKQLDAPKEVLTAYENPTKSKEIS